MSTAVQFADGRRLDIGAALGVARSPFTGIGHPQEDYPEMARLASTGIVTGGRERRVAAGRVGDGEDGLSAGPSPMPPTRT
ncbi:hypothetical protein GCM10011374_29160 [Kocuria dechangensis]|uniref:Uncharacterized protein n=1 Tax=Kocuria dechangensis TaxID=1176249 RepID=A0A917LYD1_9MICC|nr:hypothetical protein [Kocuria dechangensis]GGG63831.1 hypothetical protein GCM10011374_29160 [Kocuria dechangensis]